LIFLPDCAHYSFVIKQSRHRIPLAREGVQGIPEEKKKVQEDGQMLSLCQIVYSLSVALQTIEVMK